MPTLNDVHSALNATDVREIIPATSAGDVVAAIRRARDMCCPICPFGGRHAMGGQQFCPGAIALDTRGLDKVTAFDKDRGLLTIGAGAAWASVVAATRRGDVPGRSAWAIRQKQTGADDMTLGGSVSCNAHGRGLLMGPMVDDVEALTLVTAEGEIVGCSRERNRELFTLAVGGYGMFGVIVDVTLRLTPRVLLRRVVDVLDLEDAANAVRRRIAEGCLYGDFQYAIAPDDDEFMRRGVFSCYRPVPSVDSAGAMPSEDLPREAWLELLRLAHTDKRRAFAHYSEHYLRSHGNVYWSDDVQMSTYIPAYAEYLARSGVTSGESLMITELYVPTTDIGEFFGRARALLRATGVENIYGTIRLIRRDTTTVLAWARDDWACVIFNLRTQHSVQGLARSAAAARGLIDAAADLGGSFYLTYHRWATREQVERCHPRIREFLAAKRLWDPAGVFQSAWWRAMAAMFEQP